MISRTRNIGGVLPIEITSFGDWQKTGLLVRDLKYCIAVGSMTGQKSAAEKLKVLIKRNLKAQGVPGGPSWPALNPDYAASKAKQGFNGEKMLIRTGLYYRSIKVWGKGTKYYVGVKHGIPSSNSKGDHTKTVGYIAHTLERGSTARNIPPRRLWVPTFKQFGGNRKIRQIIAWHIARLIYLRHGVRVKMT